jgi:hypothetical protein
MFCKHCDHGQQASHACIWLNMVDIWSGPSLFIIYRICQLILRMSPPMCNQEYSIPAIPCRTFTHADCKVERDDSTSELLLLSVRHRPCYFVSGCIFWPLALSTSRLAPATIYVEQFNLFSAILAPPQCSLLGRVGVLLSVTRTGEPVTYGRVQ